MLSRAAESRFPRISVFVSAPGLSARGSQPTSAVAARDQPGASGKCHREFRLRKSASECCRLPQSEYAVARSEEHTSELQSQSNLVCRLLLEKKKKEYKPHYRREIHKNSIPSIYVGLSRYAHYRLTATLLQEAHS